MIILFSVQGEFFPPSRYHDPQIKLNPTIGRKFIIKCPAHRTGYGTKVKWGTISENTNLPSFFGTSRPHKRGFPMSGNQFAFAYVTRDDLIFSKNVGGMRCILVNFGFIVASAQMVLWQAYNSKLFYYFSSFIPYPQSKYILIFLVALPSQSTYNFILFKTHSKPFFLCLRIAKVWNRQKFTS